MPGQHETPTNPSVWPRGDSGNHLREGCSLEKGHCPRRWWEAWVGGIMRFRRETLPRNGAGKRDARHIRDIPNVNGGLSHWRTEHIDKAPDFPWCFPLKLLYQSSGCRWGNEGKGQRVSQVAGSVCVWQGGGLGTGTQSAPQSHLLL